MGFVSSIMTVFGEDMTHRSWLVFNNRIDIEILNRETGMLDNTDGNITKQLFWLVVHWLLGFAALFRGWWSQQTKQGGVSEHWGFTRDTGDLNQWPLWTNRFVGRSHETSLHPRFLCWDAKTSSMRQLVRLFSLDPAKKIPSDSDPFVLCTTIDA